MSLKTATTIALAGIAADLIVTLIRWIFSTFNILQYSPGNIWINEVLWLATILFSTVPIMIFLFVLRQKQTGGNNG